MIKGINHITLSVTNIKRSFDFYRDIIGLKPLCRWHEGAYFLAGETWFCLNQEIDIYSIRLKKHGRRERHSLQIVSKARDNDPGTSICLSIKHTHDEYTHFAFDVKKENFSNLSQLIIDSCVHIFKSNQSEGESLYFCDPDGHKLELHVGSWQTRLISKRNDTGSWKQVEFFYRLIYVPNK